jgi:hypothetical protein
MTERPGTLELVARELAAAVAPLEQHLAGGNAEEFIARFGIRLPGGMAQAAAAFSATAVKAGGAASALARLTDAIDDEDAARIVAEGIATINALGQAFTAIGGIGPALSDAVSASAGLTPAQRARLHSEVAALPGRLLQTVMADYVEARNGDLFAGLRAAGLIDDVVVDGDPSDPTSVAGTHRELRVDRVPTMLSSPGAYLRETTGLGEPGFDGSKLWPRVTGYLDNAELPFTLIEPPGQPPILEAYLLRLAVVPGGPPGLSARLRVPAIEDVKLRYPIGGPWALTVTAAARFDAGLEATIRPPLQVTLTPPSGSLSGSVTAGLEAARPGETLLLLGQAGGSRVELTRFAASAGLAASVSTSVPLTLEPTAQAALDGGHVLIDLSSGDSFVRTLTGGGRIDSNFDLSAVWSPTKGLRLEGSAGIEIAIPTHVELGPIEITSLFLRTTLGTDGSLPTEISGSFSAELGPLTATVERIGLMVNARFPPGGGGNLGPLDLGFAFKPPTGVGLAVDAGVVSGGGFLSIDPDRGEYAGALELEFSGVCALKAIGIITTRRPDGSDGFSLLIVITTDFGTGIQLGFGFTLLAVGGVLGLNRSMALQPLMEGVRTNAIESLMFPQDVVANAQRIISDLRTFFPPQDGTFVIGPMAKLGWGTPTLVSVAIGVIIEIPGNVAILGVLKVALPADDVAIIKIQVNFAGAIEFDRKRVYFFAALYDSRILTITLEGEMAMLAAFGDDANFVLSVGGFHPSFQPPPLPVPSPRRISVDIINRPGARITVSGYFAVTTNTVQFGARAELVFGFDDFGISGHIGFDALIQFSPFHFVVTVSASVDLKVFGMGLFSIHLRFELSGPTPWRAKGTGSLSLLFFDISADFDITWGEERDTELPDVAVMGLIAAEYAKQGSWTAQLPAGSSLLVSLRSLDPAANDLVLHPVGSLRVSQRAVPLDLTIAKVGNRKAADAKRLALGVTSGGLAKRGDVDEAFAPAQFQDFDDAERLAKPAYQKLHGGIELSASGDALRSGQMIKRVVRYELYTIDTAGSRHRRFRPFAIGLFTHFLAGAAVSNSLLSQHREQQLKPFADKIAVADDAFAVVSAADNSLVQNFASEAMAQEHLASLGDGSLHVVPAYEAVAA